MEFLSTVYDEVDAGKKCFGLFMDLSKAFDMVDHKLLLQKLYNYGLRGNIHHWLASYLTCRRQVVEVDRKISEERFIETGVPQGSILGPLLFVLFVNDLPNVITTGNLVMYADDNSYCLSHENIGILIRDMQVMIDNFVKWFSQNNLILNQNKTVFMNFTPRKKDITASHLLKIGRHSVEQTTTTKFLGVHIDCDLGWATHVDSLGRVLSPICYAIYRLAGVTSINVVKQYYFACFESRIRYCVIYWGNYTLSSRIFRLQKWAIRNMYGVSRRHSCRGLFKRARILPLACIYIYETIVTVYSVSDSLVRNCDLHSYGTRRADDFTLPRHNLSTFESSPKYMGSKLYNKLSHSIKSANSYSSFKIRLKKFLLEKCYYSVRDYLDESY